MIRTLLPLILGALVLITGTSCFDILETIRLNKDGSGSYSVKMDLSEAMEMAMQFAGSMDGEGEGVEEGMAEAMNEVMDTVFSFADAPDSARMAWQYPEVTSRAKVHMTMDGPAETLIVEMQLPFDAVAEIDQFGGDLNRTEDLGMMDALGSGPESGGNPLMLSAPDQFTFSKGRLTRKAIPGSALFGGESADEDIQMMKMFLSGATYTVRYELPGKVKKINGEGFEQPDKKTVVMERDIDELMEAETDLAVDIRFK